MTQIHAQPVRTMQDAKRMNRFELTKRLVAKLAHEEAVVAGIGNTNFDLYLAGPRPQNFYMLGSMGLAIPIAFGVALAQPQRRVIAIEGDGSLLMELSCLATIGVVAPKNLAIVVMDNSVYQITGSQPTATSKTCDFVAVAKAVGIADAFWAGDESEFDALVDRALAASAPVFIGARVDGKPAAGETERDPARIKDSFMTGLGVRKRFGS
jgi:thiamine pyrophosphate-dependent acetolactate synthase large subunit-like protein